MNNNVDNLYSAVYRVYHPPVNQKYWEATATYITKLAPGWPILPSMGIGRWFPLHILEM